MTQTLLVSAGNKMVSDHQAARVAVDFGFVFGSVRIGDESVPGLSGAMFVMTAK